LHHERTIPAAGDEVDFALIGHQESWKAAADVLAVLRGPEHLPLPDNEIKDILPWIPPRAVCHVEVGSRVGSKIGDWKTGDWKVGGTKARGLYIDSFIPPDQLGADYLRDNLARVRAAAACAINAEAKIVSLGGFSSILIEGNFDLLPERHNTVFTTGNTLTVAFIVQGIRKMCALEGRNLRRSTLLIVGATGDVGSGCARCLAPLMKSVLVCARNVERLRKLAAELEADGVQVEIATDPLANGLPQFSVEADVVICAASLAFPSFLPGRIAPDAIICDAGYPKNLSPRAEMSGAKVFFGGLGQITGGMKFTPDFGGILNRHPFPDVVHGCLLEGMALALERRFEPFSQGRGFITPERVAEIETIAARNGIYLAPLYNADGPVEVGVRCQMVTKPSLCSRGGNSSQLPWPPIIPSQAKLA
jgi:fatty aldehyde-generating acyl-ACP reductase